jgi:hypothetical protein
MEKVQRGQTPSVKRDYLAESKKLTTSAELRQLWNEARIGKASESVLASIQALGESLAKAESQN